MHQVGRAELKMEFGDIGGTFGPGRKEAKTALSYHADSDRFALPTYAQPACWGFPCCTKIILLCINMPCLRLLQSRMRCRGKVLASYHFDWRQTVPPAYHNKSQLNAGFEKWAGKILW